MIYKDLITKIKTTLEGVPSVRKIYGYPLDEGETIEKYPAVIFFPDSFENQFHTTTQNEIFYQFKMYVVVETNNISQSDIFTDLLPSVVDKIIEKFASDWDMGTVGGSRVRALLNSGIWTQSVTETGRTAVAELNLVIRTLNNINI
jgi:hypothetical protein